MEATKQLRKAGYPYLIFGITGNVLDDDIYEYLDAGADMVLGKPLQATALSLLLKFIELNGTESKYTDDMKLIEISNQLTWITKNTNCSTVKMFA